MSDAEAAWEDECERRAAHNDDLWEIDHDGNAQPVVLHLTGARYGYCLLCDHPLESASEQESGVHARHADDAGMPPRFWNEDA